MDNLNSILQKKAKILNHHNENMNNNKQEIINIKKLINSLLDGRRLYIGMGSAVCNCAFPKLISCSQAYPEVFMFVPRDPLALYSNKFIIPLVKKVFPDSELPEDIAFIPSLKSIDDRSLYFIEADKFKNITSIEEENNVHENYKWDGSYLAKNLQLILKLDCKIFTPEEQETTLYYIVMNIEEIKEPNVIGELYRLKRLIFNVDNSNKSDSYKLYRDIVNTPPATVKTVKSTKQIKILITGRGFTSKEYVYNDENFYFETL